MQIIDDFCVDDGEERFVGILIEYEGKYVWLFNERIHGFDVTFGRSACVVTVSRNF